MHLKYIRWCIKNAYYVMRVKKQTYLSNAGKTHIFTCEKCGKVSQEIFKVCNPTHVTFKYLRICYSLFSHQSFIFV